MTLIKKKETKNVNMHFNMHAIYKIIFLKKKKQKA